MVDSLPIQVRPRRLKHDDAMGECRVKLRSLTMGQTLDFVEALSTQGGLTFCVSWEEVAPYELKPGKMHVQVCYATDLIAADNNGLSDPYCKLTWLGQKGRTKIVPKTSTPNGTRASSSQACNLR